jgi:hypothetical protein
MALALASERGVFKGNPDLACPSSFRPVYVPRKRSLTRAEVVALLPALNPNAAAIVTFILATSAEFSAIETVLQREREEQLLFVEDDGHDAVARSRSSSPSRARRGSIRSNPGSPRGLRPGLPAESVVQASAPDAVDAGGRSGRPVGHDKTGKARKARASAGNAAPQSCGFANHRIQHGANIVCGENPCGIERFRQLALISTSLGSFPRTGRTTDRRAPLWVGS